MHLDLMLLHQSAIANAIQRNDEFYTLTIGETTSHLMLPTPQTCGTMTQQRTYAMDKAQQLLNTFGK